jgi:drug/metabolite transporter (DMT)-like permease
MIGALGTLFFFAVTPVFAHRAARLLGSLRANAWRLTLAAALLGAWAHAAGRGLGGEALPWFVCGGAVGFGVGGVAMFQSLPRLGSNLSTLIVQCGSALVAVAVEWFWLGATLSAGQLAAVGLTLTGVTLGLLPAGAARPKGGALAAGVAWAVLSAAGQGVGAVISRKAFQVAAAAGERIDPGSAAYQRVLGGLAIAWLVHGLVSAYRRGGGSDAAGGGAGGGRETADGAVAARRAAWPWVTANALTGPVLGVTCFQWALRTVPAGIVQPIVAAAPLLTIPLAAWLEGTRPRALYYVGAALAVTGVAWLVAGR